MSDQKAENERLRHNLEHCKQVAQSYLGIADERGQEIKRLQEAIAERDEFLGTCCVALAAWWETTLAPVTRLPDDVAKLSEQCFLEREDMSATIVKAEKRDD